ncbi:Tetraspanin family protein [Entamoeba marina]
MKNNIIKEWIGITTALNAIISIGVITYESSQDIPIDTRYYAVRGSILFWICITVLCFLNTFDSFFPLKLSRFFEKNYVWSVLLLILSCFAILGVVLMTTCPIVRNSEIQRKTEAYYYCCVTSNNQIPNDCGCLKYNGTQQVSHGIWNRFYYGRFMNVNCRPCKIGNGKFSFATTLIVNYFTVALFIFFSFLHWRTELHWLSLDDTKRSELDQTKFVRNEIEFVQKFFAERKLKSN